MSGSFWLLDAPTEERALAVSFEASTEDVRGLVAGRGFEVAGTIDAQGIAAGSDLSGSVGSRLFHERRIPYRFAFFGDDGRRYELSGQREWSGLAPVDSLTLLPATLYDEHGEEIGRATLRFDWRADSGHWLKSWRVRLSR